MEQKLRSLVPFASNFFSRRPTYQVALTPLMIIHSSSLGNTQSRTLTTKTLAKGIELVTTNKHIATVPGNSLQLAVDSQLSEEKPLCLLLCWLMSQRKHVMKYARFYLDQGFTCLTVSLTPWQLLWPVTGSQLVAKDILTFLSSNRNYQSTILHGFSVGGYLYGEVLNMMSQDTQKYGPVINQIKGQIWDSVVDMEGIPVGMPRAVFPNNALLRNSLEKYIRYHMAKFHESATKHYNLSSHNYHNPIVKVPALFLCSLDDTVGSIEGIKSVSNDWESQGMEVFLKVWESSPHVGHLHHHPEEYKLEMKAFLERLELVPYPEKFLHHLPHSRANASVRAG